MTKTIGLSGLGLIILLGLFVPHDTKPKARAALLLDVNSGDIVYEHHADKPVAVASLAKLMTEYLLLESIHSGEISWNDQVLISQTAAEKEGVSIRIKAGDKVTICDLFYAMAIPSANNAATALAEHVSGSEEAFTVRMNEKAAELGLMHTHFVNATGLTENGQHSEMTAQDVAKLAQTLIQDFPEILHISSLATYTLDHNQQEVETTNHMLLKKGLGFSGLDGLKTGYTNAAGYCFVGTAERDGQRFISVVLGTKQYNARFVETQKLLSLGFQQLYVPSLEAYGVKLRELKEMQ